MPRFKQTFSGGLKFKAEPEYAVLQHEIDLLQENMADMCVTIEDSKNGELLFKTPGGRTLAQELESGINAARLAEITRCVLQLVSLLERTGLCTERVLFSPALIYVSPQNGKLRFVYLPVNGRPFQYDFSAFLLELIHRTKMSGPVREQWSKWQKLLLGPKNYKYWLSSVPQSGRGTRSETCSAVLTGDEAVTALDDDQALDLGLDFGKEPFPDMEMDDEAATGLDENGSIFNDWKISAHPVRTESFDDGEAPTGLDNDELIDFMDQADGTFSESFSEWTNHVPAKLVPLGGGTEVRIDKTNFKLGRSPQRADYCIANKSVSNVHATIIKNGTEYFLKDNGSTNGTFLNDRRVESSAVPVRLKNGDVIRLWNLEYQFVLE